MYPSHLWGVKLGFAKTMPEQVVSIDSGAWNGMIGRTRNLWKIETKPDGGRYTQREWCLKVALPKYEQSIQDTLVRSKHGCVSEDKTSRLVS